jgi:hypothetical protein
LLKKRDSFGDEIVTSLKRERLMLSREIPRLFRMPPFG